MPSDLSDEETAVVLRELDRIIDGDPFPLSVRIRTLTAIRDKDSAVAGARAVAASTGVCVTASGSSAVVR